MIKLLRLSFFIAIFLFCSCDKEEAQAPPLIIYTPSVVDIGTTITIAGKYFGNYRDEVEVRFNGVPVSYADVRNNGTNILCTVPDNITPGKITVSVNSMVAESPDSYAVSNWKLLSDPYPSHNLEDMFCKYNNSIFFRQENSIMALNLETKARSAPTNFPAEYPNYDINDPHSHPPISFFTIENRIFIQFIYKLSGEDFFRFYEYNLDTKQWAEKGHFPRNADANPSGFSLAGKGYFIFRYNDNEELWRYEPTTDTWAQLANFPGPLRSNYVIYTTSSHVYLGAGRPSSGAELKDRWQYEPISNTWTKIEDFPGSPRSNPLVYSINNHIYYGVDKEDAYEFDPVLNNWIPYQNIISGESLSFGGRTNYYFSHGDKGYLISGALWEFNP